MKKLMLLMLISFNVDALEYSIDYSTANIDYGWYADEVDNVNYNKDMSGFGLSAFKDNWGVRAAYMRGGAATATGRYSTFIVDMKSVTSLELIYKRELFDNVSVFGCVGYYWVPVPMTSEAENFYDNDRDDGEGWCYGISVKMYNRWSVSYRYTKYSTIKTDEFNEWMDGYSVQWEYKL